MMDAAEAEEAATGSTPTDQQDEGTHKRTTLGGSNSDSEPPQCDVAKLARPGKEGDENHATSPEDKNASSGASGKTTGSADDDGPGDDSAAKGDIDMDSDANLKRPRDQDPSLASPEGKNGSGPP